MENFGIPTVAVITALVFGIGLVVKSTKLSNTWIPAICAVSGVILGIVGMFVIPDFPATDVLTAAAVGLMSGLMATGANELVKETRKGVTSNE